MKHDGILLTNRLLLRPLTESDSGYFLAYLPEVDQFLSLIAPTCKEEADTLVKNYMGEERKGTSVYFAIENKETKEFIGVVGVNSLDKDWPERHCWIRKDMQNKGYAFEAISAFMEWANKYLDYTIMYSSFDVTNKAMMHLNEKLGGVKGDEKPEPVLQESGKILNILYYSYPKPIL